MSSYYDVNLSGADDFDDALTTFERQLADQKAENDKLKAEVARLSKNKANPGTTADVLDKIEAEAQTREQFYEALAEATGNRRDRAGNLVDEDGNVVCEGQPIFDLGGKPVNEEARQLLRQRDPRYAALEAEVDGGSR